MDRAQQLDFTVQVVDFHGRLAAHAALKRRTGGSRSTLHLHGPVVLLDAFEVLLLRHRVDARGRETSHAFGTHPLRNCADLAAGAPERRPTGHDLQAVTQVVQQLWYLNRMTCASASARKFDRESAAQTSVIVASTPAG